MISSGGNTFNIAISGLNAASTKLAVSANNVANQFSTKTLKDGVKIDKPYVPQKVDNASLSTGGVIANVSDVNPATVPQFNPAADNADANGVSLAPNVNLESEIVTQIVAAYTYKANLKVIKTQDDMDKRLLDITS